jgi:hypothetical protein
MSSNEDQTEKLTKEEVFRRPKRNKKKKEKTEDNAALDPVRYKTKMCKNWQLHEKCPYGPRCLFAHGVKEMRTFSHNSHAIHNACNSEAPDRQFYALGHFPAFMPHPFAAEGQTNEEQQQQPVEQQTPVEQEEAADLSQVEGLPLAALTDALLAEFKKAPAEEKKLEPNFNLTPSPASQCIQYPYFPNTGTATQAQTPAQPALPAGMAAYWWPMAWLPMQVASPTNPATTLPELLEGISLSS